MNTALLFMLILLVLMLRLWRKDHVAQAVRNHDLYVLNRQLDTENADLLLKLNDLNNRNDRDKFMIAAGREMARDELRPASINPPDELSRKRRQARIN